MRAFCHTCIENLLKGPEAALILYRNKRIGIQGTTMESMNFWKKMVSAELYSDPETLWETVSRYKQNYLKFEKFDLEIAEKLLKIWYFCFGR